MKCKYCNYNTSFKSEMIKHLKLNHKEQLKAKLGNRSMSQFATQDSLFEDIATENFDLFINEDSYIINGGGASGSWSDDSNSGEQGDKL